MHCGGAGDRGENNKERHSEWDWSVLWASRTFSEEVPLSSLKERGEKGDSKHGEQQEQRPGCVEHVTIHGPAKPTGWSQGLGDEAAARVGSGVGAGERLQLCLGQVKQAKVPRLPKVKLGLLGRTSQADRRGKK